MGPSVDDGYNEGVRLATQVFPNNLLFPFGYSQGAICASHFLRDFIIKNNLRGVEKMKCIDRATVEASPRVTTQKSELVRDRDGRGSDDTEVSAAGPFGDF